MKLRTLVLALFIAAVAMPALATVRVFTATPPSSPGGDQKGEAESGQGGAGQPGSLQGQFEVTDTGGGAPTLSGFEMHAITQVDFPNITVFGPGGYVFIDATPTIELTALPYTGTGSAAAGGSVAWGLISGWKTTGKGFCKSSPVTICSTGALLAHGMTSALQPPGSNTYDLGTWDFSTATGDLEARNFYINLTNNGGTSNRQRLIRGTLQGTTLPALPLVGAGALALGLLVAGTRSVMRKK